MGYPLNNIPCEAKTSIPNERNGSIYFNSIHCHHATKINTSVVTSRVIDSDSSGYFQRLDSSGYFQRLDSSPKQKMTRLESTAPNDSTLIRLADVAVNYSSTQLQLVQNKFIKIIVIELLGKNNEPCEQ